MKFIIIGLLLLSVSKNVVAQYLTYEDVYEINTKLAISSNYQTQGKYSCAIDLLKKLEVNLVQIKENNYLLRVYNKLAEAYIKLGDSEQCEFYYSKILPYNYYFTINEIRKESSPFNFVYKNNKQILDSIFLREQYDDSIQKLLINNKEKLIQMITLDQYARLKMKENDVKQFESTCDTIISTMLKSIDSLNKLNLITMLDKDQSCNISKYEFTNLYLLNLHLSRYDTASFVKLFKYNERCMGKGNYLNAILLENRLYANYQTKPLLVYLPEYNFAIDFNFAEVDEERRTIGIQSLYFDLLLLNLKIPDYYNDYDKRYFTCRD
jgi:hypothetical protein